MELGVVRAEIQGHQVNGGFGEITQIRRLGDAAAHLDEFQAVMATAAGRAPLRVREDFSHATVEVIPDTLRAADAREAITALLAQPSVEEKGSLAAGLDATRRTD